MSGRHFLVSLRERERGKQLREDIVIEFYYQGRSKVLGRKHLCQKYKRQRFNTSNQLGNAAIQGDFRISIK